MSEFNKILSGQPAFRLRQIKTARFDPSINGYNEITTLSKDLREKLKNIPWLSVKEKTLQTSAIDGTEKALLELQDGRAVETVMMPRVSKNGERYTVCLSSQVGCPLKCAFCATGTLGFTRNLSAEEIEDQFRFWQKRLGGIGEIENIVLMGQGEPLLNYEAVKEVINDFLIYAEIAPRKITLSTVGVREGMEKILSDENFPKIRFALSLHSAISETRKIIIPTHDEDFFEFLIDWSARYHKKYPARNFFIGLEYLLLGNFNDDDKHLKALAKLAAKLGRVRINLIPFNKTAAHFAASDEQTAKKFQNFLNDMGIIATIRNSQGSDIDAACGQLSLKC